MLRNLIFNFIYYFRSFRLARKILMRRDKVSFLKKEGARIGKDCRILSMSEWSEPFLIEVGDHVSIGTDVQLITHDGAVWVLRTLANNPDLDLFGPIKIGNNVFIGNNAIILPNVIIGDNVIVAAGAVVSRNIESGSIVAGVPAKRIGDVNDYMVRKLKLCMPTKRLSSSQKKLAIQKMLFSETKNDSGKSAATL